MCRGQLGNAPHTAPPPPPSAARSSPGWPLTLEVTDFCMETLPAMRLSRRSGGKIFTIQGRKERRGEYFCWASVWNWKEILVFIGNYQRVELLWHKVGCFCWKEALYYFKSWYFVNDKYCGVSCNSSRAALLPGDFQQVEHCAGGEGQFGPPVSQYQTCYKDNFPHSYSLYAVWSLSGSVFDIFCHLSKLSLGRVALLEAGGSCNFRLLMNTL